MGEHTRGSAVLTLEGAEAALAAAGVPLTVLRFAVLLLLAGLTLRHESRSGGVPADPDPRGAE